MREMSALVLDLDGVVYEAWGFARWLERVHGLGRADTAPFFLGPFARCVLGETDLDDELPTWLERWNWKDGADTFLEAWFREDGRRDPAVVEQIGRYRAAGWRCFAASTQERRRASWLRADVGDLFEDMYFSCEVGVAKPDPRFFERVQARIGLPAESLTFWDDMEQNAAGARAAGWSAHTFNSALDLARDPPR